MATAILDLFLGARPSAGRQIEERPKRLDSAHMPHVLTLIHRLEKWVGCPVQPDPPMQSNK